MPEKNIKILLVTHKPCEIPKFPYIVPIHAGRDVALEASKDGTISKKDFDWLLNNTIGDNTGDNISKRNRYYSECSALYWAWKNYDKLDNPDYLGLMHYRRHFIFSNGYFKEKLKTANIFCKAFYIIEEDFIDANYLNRIGFNTSNIQNAISNYDAILSYPCQMNICYPIDKSSVRDDYIFNIPQVNVNDFDLMVEILKKKYPNYSDKIHKFINNPNKYSFQMFIMKRELLFKYCEFLFDILFEIENSVDFTTYGPNGKRTLGYLAEILSALFFVIKDPNKQYKKLELGVTFCKYPETSDILKQKANDLKFSYFKYLKYKFGYLTTINKKRKNSFKKKYKQAKAEAQFIKLYKRNLKGINHNSKY